MRLAVQAVSAKMGGAKTYLEAVLPLLAERITDRDEILFLHTPGNGLRAPHPRIRERVIDAYALDDLGLASRVRFDQVDLPLLLAREGASAVLNTANFGALWSPCPAIVLVRNALYFEDRAMRRAPSARLALKLRVQRVMCLLAMARADVVLFPSQSMMDLAARFALRGATRRWRVAPYGVRHDLMRPRPVPDAREARWSPSAPFRLVHVSLYADHKNLCTVFDALHELHRTGGPPSRLTLTCGIHSAALHEADWHRLAEDRRLFAQLERAGLADDTGPMPYPAIAELYGRADAFLWPSYTESFGHPVVEAMACGLPIIAADTPVNREQCGDAAHYFSTFDSKDCARAIARVAEDAGLRARLRQASVERARAFTWEAHVDALTKAFEDVIAGRPS